MRPPSPATARFGRAGPSCEGLACQGLAPGNAAAAGCPRSGARLTSSSGRRARASGASSSVLRFPLISPSFARRRGPRRAAPARIGSSNPMSAVSCQLSAFSAIEQRPRARIARGRADRRILLRCAVEGSLGWLGSALPVRPAHPRAAVACPPDHPSAPPSPLPRSGPRRIYSSPLRRGSLAAANGRLPPQESAPATCEDGTRTKHELQTRTRKSPELAAASRAAGAGAGRIGGSR
jgi:hypothetical protein